jgi:hypothetical protein
MNWGSVDLHKEYVTLKKRIVMGGALTSGRIENQVGITPFAYCYAEINLKSV